MDDKITLDRDTFKALAVDTRVRMLRILAERQHTLSDLAEDLGLAPSTVKEHLDVLVAAGLIVQMDKGTKWKYYRLTAKGKEIVNPYEKKVWIVLAATLVALSASVYVLWDKLKMFFIMPHAMGDVYEAAPNLLGAGAEEDTRAVVSKAAEAVPDAVPQATYDQATNTLSQMPYLEVAAVIVFAVLLGACIGYLFKRRKAI